MAVRKTKTQEEVLEVEVTQEVEDKVEEQEVEVEIPNMKVSEPEEQEVNEPEVEVDLSVTEAKRPSGFVKIRMRTDHKCCIAMERYDLKAGKTYNVPENVKEILNNAGLLAPL